MKKWIYISLCAMACWGCEDIRPPQNQPRTVTVAITGIIETSAVCAISIEPSGAAQKAGIVYGTDPSLQANTAEASAASVSESNATVTLRPCSAKAPAFVEAKSKAPALHPDMLQGGALLFARRRQSLRRAEFYLCGV
jgi:hypothetical protein